tara:strand:+ start:761 stop:985 length:225 start_codon:yes stop_codon:yes gene_type:complete
MRFGGREELGAGAKEEEEHCGLVRFSELFQPAGKAVANLAGYFALLPQLFEGDEVGFLLLLFDDWAEVANHVGW